MKVYPEHFYFTVEMQNFFLPFYFLNVTVILHCMNQTEYHSLFSCEKKK